MDCIHELSMDVHTMFQQCLAITPCCGLVVAGAQSILLMDYCTDMAQTDPETLFEMSDAYNRRSDA